MCDRYEFMILPKTFKYWNRENHYGPVFFKSPIDQVSCGCGSRKCLKSFDLIVWSCKKNLQNCRQMLRRMLQCYLKIWKRQHILIQITIWYKIVHLRSQNSLKSVKIRITTWTKLLKQKYIFTKTIEKWSRTWKLRV